jgi:hypothetical protein
MISDGVIGPPLKAKMTGRFHARLIGDVLAVEDALMDAHDGMIDEIVLERRVLRPSWRSQRQERNHRGNGRSASQHHEQPPLSHQEECRYARASASASFKEVLFFRSEH